MKRQSERDSKASKAVKKHKDRDEADEENGEGRSRRKVDWNWEELGKLEQERHNNPVKSKIDEPKTPFVLYESGDNAYLNKVNQIYKTKPSIKEVLDDVSNKLKEKRIKVDHIEVEVIDEDGVRKREYFPKDHQSPNEFLLKRKNSYLNEFTEAKNHLNFQDDDQEEDKEEEEDEEDEISRKEEEELDNLTMKNTLLNKVVGRNSSLNKQGGE